MRVDGEGVTNLYITKKKIFTWGGGCIPLGIVEHEEDSKSSPQDAQGGDGEVDYCA